MKKVLVLLCALATFATACKKETVQPKEAETALTVVSTDDPPAAIWGQYSDSGYTWKAYVTEEDLKTITVGKYGCINDNYSGQSYQCGLWSMIKTHKYYGIYKGKLYISKSIIVLSGNQDDLASLRDAINRKGTVIQTYCTGCTNYPYNNLGAELMTGLDGPNIQKNTQEQQ